MNLDHELINIIIKKTQIENPNLGNLLWSSAPKKFTKWLNNQINTNGFVDQFCQLLPQDNTQIGWAMLYPCRRIMDNTHCNTISIPNGFLQIGTMSNGDYVFINLNNDAMQGFVGYISHEEENQLNDISSYIKYVSPTIGMFVLGMQKDALPIDYYWTWSEENEIGTY